jgi:hypothetical protein
MSPTCVANRRAFRHRLAPVAVALAGALSLSLTAFAAPSHAQSGDLPARADSAFGCGKYMSTEATYFRSQHRIVGHSRLSNNCQLLGFHSGVVALLGNAEGRLVAYGEPRRYGIEARGPCVPFFGCPPTRVRHDFWQDHVDPNEASGATSLTLVQYPAPNDLLDSLHAFRVHMEAAVAAGKSIAEAIAIAKALG